MLPGFKPAKAMVFAGLASALLPSWHLWRPLKPIVSCLEGLFPVDGGEFDQLQTASLRPPVDTSRILSSDGLASFPAPPARPPLLTPLNRRFQAMEQLTLNDSSVTVHRENSDALGAGYRCGFLGLLHLEVFLQVRVGSGEREGGRGPCSLPNPFPSASSRSTVPRSSRRPQPSPSSSTSLTALGRRFTIPQAFQSVRCLAEQAALRDRGGGAECRPPCLFHPQG